LTTTPEANLEPGLIEEIRRFERKYADDPHGLVFARLADVYRKAGALERGLQIVREGLHRHPEYLNARIVHARILRELGRTRDATAAFEQVVELDSQNLISLRTLGELAAENGDPALAAVWYGRLLEVEPLNEEVRELLRHAVGEEDSEMSSPEELPPADAESEAIGRVDVEPAADEDSRVEPDPMAGQERGVDQKPENDEPTMHDGDLWPGEVATATMAELYLRQGLYEEAARILERLVAASPSDAHLAARLESARELLEHGEAEETTVAVDHSEMPQAPVREELEAEQGGARRGTIRDYLQGLVAGAGEPE